MKTDHIFIWGLFIILLGGVGIYLARPVFLGIVKEEEKKREKVQVPQPASKEISAPVETRGSVNRIVPEEEFDGSIIQYSEENGFIPNRIKIKPEESGLGCFIKIVNKSVKPLTIRLSPHSSKDNHGFLYPSIPPGEDSIIDPRYRIEKIAFHNHEKPKDDFFVDMNSQCLP